MENLLIQLESLFHRLKMFLLGGVIDQKTIEKTIGEED